MEIKRDNGRSVPAIPRLQQIDSGWSDAKLEHLWKHYITWPNVATLYYTHPCTHFLCYCWLYNHLNLKYVISHVMTRPLEIEWKKWKNKGNERSKGFSGHILFARKAFLLGDSGWVRNSKSTCASFLINFGFFEY